MIENEALKIFKLKDMEMDKSYSVELESGHRLTANDIYYEDNIVSRVEFSKHNFSKSKTDSLFIYFFMGNIKLGCILSKVDCVLEKDPQYEVYTIREAIDHDYQKTK